MGYAKVADLPIDRKKLLTIKEAAVYTGIGMCKLRELANENKQFKQFVIMNGSKLLINRTKLDAFLDSCPDL